MWVLQLNPMTANAERVVPVACAETRQQLEAFMNEQTAPEPYRDGQWGKVFRQGSTLEWFNPPFGDESFIGTPAFVDIGTEDDWAQEAIQRYRDFLMQVYHV
jgi:hypothetical protein